MVLHLHEVIEQTRVVHAGGEHVPLFALQAQGVVGDSGLAPGRDVRHLHIERRVLRAHVQQQGRRVADAGDALARVVVEEQREVAHGLRRREIGVRQQEEVRDHQVGEPVFLQLRQTVEEVEDTLALLLNDAVHLHGEALKADVRVDHVFLRVCAAARHRLGVHDLLMLAEAEIDDALAAARHVHHKAVRDIDVVREIVDLPDDVFARLQPADRRVQPGKPGAHPIRQSVFHSLHKKRSSLRFRNGLLYRQKAGEVNQECGVWS